MKKYGVGKVAKVRSIYVCQNCGYETPKWMGKCPECNNWNTLVEEIRDTKSNQSSPKVERQIGELKKIKEIKSGEKERYDTGIGELNRVLGGGIVRDSVVILTAKPGAGKSTLLLQLSDDVSREGLKVLYVTGEESETQIRDRSVRLGIKSENIINNIL